MAEKLSREEYVYLAKVSEKAERYEEVVELMEKVVMEWTPASELSVEERKLLSVAYKHVIGKLRASWRNMSVTEKNEKEKELVKGYKSKVEKEMSQLCATVINLIDSNLLPSASDSESKVFYMKMKADYHRYLAEFKVAHQRKTAVQDTISFYKAAQEIAYADLGASNPVRLGVALNLSVFYYEILKKSDEACWMAKEAYDEAMAEIDSLKEEESHKESRLMMEIIRDNYTFWTCPYLQN